jgi:RND family efflux transporter MFP subunit
MSAKKGTGCFIARHTVRGSDGLLRNKAACPLFCAVLFAVACGGAEGPERARTAVKVRLLEKAGAGQGLRYSASINAGQRVDLSFRNGGYIEAITQVKGVDGAQRTLQDGDRVTKGMELARVRRKDFEQKLSEARAALAEASAQRTQADRDYSRASKLVASGSISRAEMDVAKAKADGARARVAGAAARVDEAKTALGDATLTSPIEGVVLHRSLEEGALISPGAPAFSIADTSKVKVVFGVPDTMLESLKLGSAQAISTEALRGKTFSGQISRIAASADAKSRVFEVEVTIPNPDDELKVGMVASLSLPVSATSALAPLVPLSAVVRSPAHAEAFAVYVVQGPDEASVAKLREVELGSFVGNSIPVKAGLKEGERVVVMGASFLSDGQSVRVIP